MFPTNRHVRPRTPSCGWRACTQLLGATVVFLVAASAGSSAPAAPHAPQAHQAGMGGPYIPADLPATIAGRVPFAYAGAMDALHPGRDDALELSASLWASPLPGAHENLPQLLPVSPVRITSGFGRRHDPLGRGDAFHSGIDFAGAVGTPVHASGDGVVTQARYSKDYGNVVMIDHGQGVVTLYAHNSRLEVRTGDVVLAGQEIAKMGSTGRSTGPHLHFEVRQSGQRIDPGRYLAGLRAPTAAPRGAEPVRRVSS
ncbi:MAG TPA: M23 family metallopeptidase [Lysobacter sp.]